MFGIFLNLKVNQETQGRGVKNSHILKNSKLRENWINSHTSE